MIGPFLDIFWTISSTTLAPDQLWRLQSDDRLNLLSSENSTHAQSCSVQLSMLTTPLQTGSTVLSGQWDTHNSLRACSPSSLKRLATVFREICFPEAARN
ncbi:hypothetical protein TNCV_2947031 [Trichonephila clavipes]|nr:hypothetical protein TNCV_2947031 [Trichonephila clavipes]